MSAETRESIKKANEHIQHAEKHLQSAGEHAKQGKDGNLAQRVEKLRKDASETRQDTERKLAPDAAQKGS